MGRTKPRKQVYELTLEDLRASPVWEFRVDAEGASGQDEATVQPFAAKGALDPAERMFVIRAIFILADGTRMTGYFTPPVKGREGPGHLQPIIVTARGQVRFWCGATMPDARRLAQKYALLGKNAPQVFPLRFESDVELVGGAARGSLPGFLVMEDFQTQRAKTIL